MKITSEKELENFEFWGGAEDLADALSHEELYTIEGILEDEYPDGMGETDLNDLFAFDGDIIATWLGLKDEEYILCRRDADYLLSEAKDLLEQIREDNFVPEFTLADAEEFMEKTGMSAKQFVENGWRAYVASTEDISVDEVDEDYYECTLEYISLEVLDEELAGTIQAFKDRVRIQDVFTPNGESMVSFRDRLTDKLESLKYTLSKDDESFVDTLISDINLCDDLCTGKQVIPGEKLEEEEQDSDIER